MESHALDPLRLVREEIQRTRLSSSRGPSSENEHRLYQFHMHMARTAFPGPSYHDWLLWLHDRLRPRFYCEIGVAYGETLSFARPETRIIGVDPDPKINRPLSNKAAIFRLPSDDFFRAGHASRILGEERLDFGFIDGLHQADQALRDFVHLERLCTPTAVLALHDVLPICEEVATPVRRTTFWTGDVFKAILALTQVRPALLVAVIPCYLSGLAIITNLDPRNTIEPTTYDAAMASWRDTPFDAAMAELERRVTILPNRLVAFARHLTTMSFPQG